jgi:hypothetical protein
MLGCVEISGIFWQKLSCGSRHLNDICYFRKFELERKF